MAQAVSRRPLTTWSWVRALVNPCGIWGVLSGTGAGFSPSSSVFPSQYHSTIILHTCISSGGWTICPLLAAVQIYSHPIIIDQVAVVHVNGMRLCLCGHQQAYCSSPRWYMTMDPNEMILTRKPKNSREKPVSVPLWPPLTPHGLIWVHTQASNAATQVTNHLRHGTAGTKHSFTH
jgi:hypothetical protein